MFLLDYWLNLLLSLLFVFSSNAKAYSSFLHYVLKVIILMSLRMSQLSCLDGEANFL